MNLGYSKKTVGYLIFILIILSVFILFTYNKYKYRWISIDGYKYIKVLRCPDYNIDVKAAKLIHGLNVKTKTLIDFLVRKYGVSDTRVKRLIDSFDYTDIEESTTTYIYNKGDYIKLKLRKSDGSFYDENFIMYVLIHELAHIITDKKFGSHEDEFNENYDWLLTEAANKSLVIPEFISNDLKRNYLN